MEIHGIQMKNLNGKRYAIALFVVFALCFCFIAIKSGKKVADLWSALSIAYKTIPIALLFVGLFIKYAWKWPLFSDWLVPFPDLNGTWQGNIETTWVTPKTGEAPKPIPVILTIKQSFIRISCVMRTAEMTSHSYLADFWLDGDEQIKMLGYNYHSKPITSVRDRSQQHDGSVVFELIGKPVNKLKGTYWTSRCSNGEVVLTYYCKKRLDEYPKALGKHPVSKKS